MRTVQDMVAEAKARIREIGPDQLREMQARGVPVVDVREPGEFAEGHIPGAVNIPRGVLEFEVDGHPAVNCVRDPALGHRDQPVILNCRSGARSAMAADALRQLGFAEPLSLAGGFMGWANAGLPVER
ncbi:rhodanese-like domain-containing protein [Arenimonas caeni]|jgi:rhodanese-related sulfurtransferase|uniref:rhodanese-like domain-containing protein n=1 Tax=Arenimonas caeni TaxID=2058085 RepID=UPI002A35F025|nr:rhodanese-like domain-containing protein [Arenimonas caeni]MDY0022114.1 rhodanese-like domain-containing protein [Arenimonas caeni]